jgi:hypothetical protein
LSKQQQQQQQQRLHSRSCFYTKRKEKELSFVEKI